MAAWVPRNSAASFEFVQKMFEFSNEIVQVIKDSFGPNGLDTLLLTSGTLILTNDGYQVVKSLSYRGPLGKLIFQGLDLFYKNTGDFSKKFILLFRELLREVLDVVLVDKTRSREKLLCIAQGMNEVLHTVFPEVLKKLQKMGVINECMGENMEDGISIMRTSISGKFSPKTCEILVCLIQQLLFSDKLSYDIYDLKQATEKLLDNFSDLVWEVAGKPLTASTVLPGLLIPRELLTMAKKLPHSAENNSFKFVILGSLLDYYHLESKTVLSLKDSQKMNDILQWRKKHIENVIKVLAMHDVELIMTSSTLHETFIHICNQYHIGAIHLIPPEDITKVSNVFGISVLFDLDEDLTSSIGKATSCKSIQVGRHVYVHIEPAANPSVKQVLLYAPTEAFCHQYSIALQRMLKMLRASLKQCQDKSYVLSIVRGGGTIELAFEYALEEYRKVHNLNSNTLLACEILQKALLSIPRQLAKNADCRLSILELKAKTRQAFTDGKQVCGLDKNGVLRNEDVIEPTMANCTLMSSVLKLFVQVLRTDGVVDVKTLPTKNVKDVNDGEDEEDSDSELDV
jgi:chaperonin GroEL (HSP60 family)